MNSDYASVNDQTGQGHLGQGHLGRPLWAIRGVVTVSSVVTRQLIVLVASLSSSH